MDKELQQVLPGLSRNQIQVLMRELRDDGQVICKGKTSAARWFVVQYTENSYGTYNVQTRLMLFTKNTSRMYVNTIEGRGTCVSIELPVIYAKKEDTNE